jgi:hypothetical protein
MNPINLYNIDEFQIKIDHVYENIKSKLRQIIIDDEYEYNIMIAGTFPDIITPRQWSNLVSCLDEQLNYLTNSEYEEWVINCVEIIINLINSTLLNYKEEFTFDNMTSDEMYDILFTIISTKLYGEEDSLLNTLIIV